MYAWRNNYTTYNREPCLSSVGRSLAPAGCRHEPRQQLWPNGAMEGGSSGSSQSRAPSHVCRNRHQQPEPGNQSQCARVPAISRLAAVRRRLTPALPTITPPTGFVFPQVQQAASFFKQLPSRHVEDDNY